MYFRRPGRVASRWHRITTSKTWNAVPYVPAAVHARAEFPSSGAPKETKKQRSRDTETNKEAEHVSTVRIMCMRECTLEDIPLMYIPRAGIVLGPLESPILGTYNPWGVYKLHITQTRDCTCNKLKIGQNTD